MIRKYFSLILGFLVVFSFVSSQTFSNSAYTSSSMNPTLDNYYSSSDFSDFWPILNDMKVGNCEAATDFAIMIPPAGCTPAVVRSDLLAEQNVPVFCKLSAVQLNPLIKIASIKSLSFSGSYPKEVVAVRFHPANAGAGIISNTLLNNPIINNIGYAVIILRKTPNESSMTKWVSGNLTARLSYDAEQAFGLGRSDFYLDYMDDSQWETESSANSFWLGRGFVRLTDVRSDRARIALYIDDKDRPYREVTLQEGKTSDLIYLPNFYCMAGFRVRLNEVVSDEDMALLWVGEDKMWVRENSQILNGRCRVESITINSAEIGSVRLNCQGEKVELSLSGAYKPNISVGDSSSIFDLGKKVVEGNSSNLDWYLGYVSAKSKSKIGNNRLEFVVLLSQENNVALDAGKLTRLKEGLARIDRTELTYNDWNGFISALAKSSNLKNGTEFVVLGRGNSQVLSDNNVMFNSISFNDLSDRDVSPNDELDESAINGNYSLYDGSVQNLIDFFPQTKSLELEERFAEKALLEQIELTNVLVGKGLKTEIDLNELREKFLRLYPDSSYAKKIRLDLDGSVIYDRTNGSVTVEINGEFYRIALDALRVSNPEDKTAEVLVNGISYGKMGLYNKKNISSGQNQFWITKIEKNRVTIEYFEDIGNDASPATNQVTLVEGESKLIGKNSNYTFLVRDVETKQVAHVSLIPEQSNARTEANFTFKIGIEKRMFEITPEKANKTLEELNKTIAQWEKRLESFGNLLEGWKKVCFFTGLGLQVKNLITGFSGEAMARQEVMKIYRDICNSDIQEGENAAVSRTQCYSALSSTIEKDVDAYKEAITETNEVLKKYKTLDDWKGFIGETTVLDSVTIEGESVSVLARDVSSWNDVRYYYLNKNFAGSDNIKSNLKKLHDANMLALARRKKSDEDLLTITQKAKKGINGFDNVRIYSTNDQRFISNSVSGLKAKNIQSKPDGLDNEEYVEKIIHEGKVYLVGLLSSGSGKFNVNLDKVYNQSGEEWSKISNLVNAPNDIGVGSLRTALGRMEFVYGGDCKNSYSNLEVRYFENEPNRERPAIVAFDAKEGWYVKVSQSQGGLISNEVQGYQESGTVRFFYVCNVGLNGREENMGGDDICQSFDVNSYGNVDNFAGCNSLSASDVKRLGDDAQEAIRQAARAYSSVKAGAKTIEIRLRGQTLKLNVGSPYSADAPIEECQDFMTIDECNLLFNVCDPVICPSSRCDFGGSIKVDNVIASGVAGSLLLCLPNFGNPAKGGVLFPVCLTGVHAGLDGWVSILRAQYACMEEATKSGKYVGICDYITAIYKCEFFWRNAQPLLRNVVPKLIEAVSDPTSLFRPRGGGEYLTFQKSWDNMDSSLNYFKNQYARTSFVGAINYSNVEEFGSEVCRQFIGTSFPTKGEAFDAMFKVDSPTQFYAEFSEIPYTEATVPPTSQYKVLYHIYAGNDRAVSYQVYLKDPPTSSYYQNNPQVYVGSGAIAQGKFASESKDFTAPQGYKQLCVNLNGQEKCGFKQVTSDVGLEMLTKSQVVSEANKRDIETEAQCISGSSSVLGMTSSLNLESGAASSLTPEIYQMGLVRVCSSENPGKGVNDNWVEVGYCGNSNIKCWLDRNSVNQNTLGVLNGVDTVKEAEEIIKNKNSLSSTLNELESNKLISSIRTDLKNKGAINSILGNISTLKERGYYDYHQANGYYLETLFYKILIEKLLGLKTTANALRVALDSPEDDSYLSVEERNDSNIALVDLIGGQKLNVGGVEYEITAVESGIITYREGTKSPRVCRFEGKSVFGDCLRS